MRKLVKKEFLETQDLMLVSLESWKKLIDSRIVWMDNIPSTLIINKKVSRFHTGARNKIVSNVSVDSVAEHL